jgi:hypothetical protein
VRYFLYISWSKTMAVRNFLKGSSVRDVFTQPSCRR